MPRSVLQDLHSNRLLLREQIAGNDLSPDDAARRARSHVNRVYRGSLGNEIVGVNTKDIAYFQGFMKMANYVFEQRENGVPMEAIYDYIMSGCFDPTEETHRAYMADKQSARS